MNEAIKIEANEIIDHLANEVAEQAKTIAILKAQIDGLQKRNKELTNSNAE